MCTSFECLEFDVSSSTSMTSWLLKIFITTFGLLGVYLVKRWKWFQTVHVNMNDDFGREHIVEERPFSQQILSQIINVVGLACIYHATSNTLISLLFCFFIVFRSELEHRCRLCYYWWYSKDVPGVIHQTISEYEQNGIDETAAALYNLQNDLNTMEGRRAMSRVSQENYAKVSRFRDGGNHYDLTEEEEEVEGGWCSKCVVM